MNVYYLLYKEVRVNNQLLQEETELMFRGEHKHALTKIIEKRKQKVVYVRAKSS